MQPSPPNPCGCHEATLQLRANISTTSHNLTPSTSPAASHQEQPPSPSLALLQGRAISEHWTRITSCPHSPSHLSSPTILRCTTRTMKRIIAHYEFFIKHMLNTAPSSYTTQDGGQQPPNHNQNTYHFTQYDDTDNISDTSSISPEESINHPLPLPLDTLLTLDSTSFIGNQPLEDDEASILFQEGVRQSMMQMSAIMRDVQRAIDNRRMEVEYERRRRQMDRMRDDDDDDGERMDEGDSEEEDVRSGENLSLAKLPDVREMGVLTMRAYELFGALDELAGREF